MEREAMLFERSQARQARQERRLLEQKIHERELEASSAAGRRVPSAAADLKRRKLEELRAQRQKKGLRRKVESDEDGEYEEDDDQKKFADSDISSSEDEYYGKSKRKTIAKPRRDEEEESSDGNLDENESSSQPLDLDYANKLRLSRDILGEWLYREGFEDVISRCLLRINIGAAHSGSPPVYRIVELRRLTLHHNIYFLKPGVPTNLAALVRFANNERTFKLDIISNSPFTESEFDYWKKECEKAGCKLPYTSNGSARRKVSKLKAFHSQPLDDAAVELMILKRRALLSSDGQIPPRNLLAEQMILRQQLKEAAERKAPPEEISRIEYDLSALAVDRQREAECERQKLQDKESLDAVNRRNRQTNRTTGRAAEIARVGSALGDGTGSANGSATLDPFQRRKCKPSIIHMGGDGAETKVAESTVSDSPSSISSSIQPQKSIIDVHQSFDIDLDI